MTLEKLKRQRAELDAKIAEIEANKVSVVVPLDEAEREKQHQEDLQRIRGFRLIDDDFMNVCFDGNIEGAELLLKIILDKPDIVVEQVTTQKVMKNLLGRDIWLDIDAHDASGKEYDIEVQRSDKGADRKRARYHSSILDAHLLQPKEDFSALPETFVIFITENDVIGRNKPLYRIERHIEEIGERFNDGEHIVYVNGENKDGTTELGKLMHDFFCTDPNDMYYEHLADKVRYFKEDEKGVATMCKAMEEMRNEAAEKERVQIAIDMIKDGQLSFEKISLYTKLTVEKLKELAKMQDTAGKTMNNTIK